MAAASHRFVISNITPGEHRIEFTGSLVNLMSPSNLRKLGDAGLMLEGVNLGVHGPYLDDARNKSVLNFLDQSEADSILFVDSDIGFKPEDVVRLISWAAASPETRPVVCGGYRSMDPKGDMIVAYHYGEGEFGDKNYVAMRDYTSKRPIRVDAAGTGFMLIQRWLLEEMKEIYAPPCPWFYEAVVLGSWDQENATPIHLGEDLGFCARVDSMGYKIWLHQNVRLSHTKMRVLGP